MPRLPRVTQGEITRATGQPRLQIGGREPQVSLTNVGLPKSRATFRNAPVTPADLGAGAFEVLGKLGEIIEKTEDATAIATKKAEFIQRVGELDLTLEQNPDPKMHALLFDKGLTEIEQNILKSGLSRNVGRDIGRFLALERARRVPAAALKGHRLRAKKVASSIPTLVSEYTQAIANAEPLSSESQVLRKDLADYLTNLEVNGLLAPQPFG